MANRIDDVNPPPGYFVVGAVSGGPGRPDEPWLMPRPDSGNMVHMLGTGATGWGKSVLLNAVCLGLAEMPSVALFGIDMKDGVELDQWGPRFTDVATGLREATVMLGDIVRSMQGRNRLLVDVSRVLQERSPGVPVGALRKWQPWMGCRVVVVVDEMKQLVGSPDAMAELTRLAELARASGVTMTLYTQYALKGDLGSTFLANVTSRAAHKMTSDNEYPVVLGKQVPPGTVMPFERGHCLLSGWEPYPDFTLAKAFYRDDAALAARIGVSSRWRWGQSAALGIPSVGHVLDMRARWLEARRAA